MPFCKLWGGLFTLALAAIGAAQTDLAVTESYACDANGNPAQIKVGENFWVGTRFHVSETPNSTFKYRVETAYGRIESPRLSFGTTPGDYFVYWGPFPALMDGPVDVKVTLDPEKKVKESNRLNNVASFQVVPASPSTATELFDPKNLTGRMGFDLTFKSSSAIPASFTSWMPAPVGEASAQAIDPTFVNLVSDPFGQPVLAKTTVPVSIAPIHEEMAVSATSYSVRSNLAMLRQMSGGVDPDAAEWLRTESLVELGRPEFQAWVDESLVSIDRQTAPSVDVAMTLYKSILRKCSYESPRGRMPSAYETLRRKKGDCGALSSLFVALCRTAGIPARTVSGFCVGTNNWHVWAEFNVNGAGWVPVDAAYAEGRQAKGSDLPIYFGVIPELNQRYVTAIGFDRQVADKQLAMLQSPAVFWTGYGVKVQRFAAFSELGQG